MMLGSKIYILFLNKNWPNMWLSFWNQMLINKYYRSTGFFKDLSINLNQSFIDKIVHVGMSNLYFQSQVEEGHNNLTRRQEVSATNVLLRGEILIYINYSNIISLFNDHQCKCTLSFKNHFNKFFLSYRIWKPKLLSCKEENKNCKECNLEVWLCYESQFTFSFWQITISLDI